MIGSDYIIRGYPFKSGFGCITRGQNRFLSGGKMGYFYQFRVTKNNFKLENNPLKIGITEFSLFLFYFAFVHR